MKFKCERQSWWGGRHQSCSDFWYILLIPPSCRELALRSASLSVQSFAVGTVISNRWVALTFQIVKTVWIQYSPLLKHSLEASRERRNGCSQNIYWNWHWEYVETYFQKKKNAEDREHEHFILSKSFDVHSLLFYGSAGVDRRRHTRSGACFEYPWHSWLFLQHFTDGDLETVLPRLALPLLSSW